MEIESKSKRAAVFNSLLGFSFEVLIAAVITISFGQGFFIFLLILAGLYILYFLVWLKKSIWLWVMYFLQVKKRLSLEFEKVLRKGNFPEPPDYIESPDDYFARIVDNKNLDDDVRTGAAVWFGYLMYPRENLKFQERVKYALAWESAIQAYKESFSTRESSQGYQGQSNEKYG